MNMPTMPAIPGITEGAGIGRRRAENISPHPIPVPSACIISFMMSSSFLVFFGTKRGVDRAFRI